MARSPELISMRHERRVAMDVAKVPNSLYVQCTFRFCAR